MGISAVGTRFGMALASAGVPRSAACRVHACGGGRANATLV